MPEKSKIRAAIDRHLPTTFASTSISMAIVITTMLMWEETGLTRWQVQAGELEQQIQENQDDIEAVAEQQKELTKAVQQIQVDMSGVNSELKRTIELQNDVLEHLRQTRPQ